MYGASPYADACSEGGSSRESRGSLRSAESWPVPNFLFSFYDKISISSVALCRLCYCSSYPETFCVTARSKYLNEQCQCKEQKSLHSHVGYDDPNAWTLKGKNVVHIADCTGWTITEPMRWRREYVHDCVTAGM